MFSYQLISLLFLSIEVNRTKKEFFCVLSSENQVKKLIKMSISLYIKYIFYFVNNT